MEWSGVECACVPGLGGLTDHTLQSDLSLSLQSGQASRPSHREPDLQPGLQSYNAGWTEVR